MRAGRLVFLLFLICSAIFVLGSVTGINWLVTGVNFLLVPLLLLLYWIKSERLFYPLVVAFIFLYFRDVFLFLGHKEYTLVITLSFLVALTALLLCAVGTLKRAKVEAVEYLSFFIMYGFLIFVFVFMADMVPQLIPDYKWATYLYLLLLVLYMAVSFTAYLLKSHYGTLWLMLSAASLLFSEVSLVFKLYIVEDYSVNIFFPVFHVFAYYALTEHGRHRRSRSLFSTL